MIIDNSDVIVRRWLDNHFYGTLSFKIMATNIYEIISNQLSLEKDSIVVKDLQEFEHYIGNYESPTISIIVKEENNNLKVKTVRKKDSLFRTEIIVPHSKAFFTIFNELSSSTYTIIHLGNPNQ